MFLNPTRLYRQVLLVAHRVASQGQCQTGESRLGLLTACFIGFVVTSMAGVTGRLGYALQLLCCFVFSLAIHRIVIARWCALQLQLICFQARLHFLRFS